MRGSRSLTTTALIACALLTGCSSSPDASADERPVRFAVIGAPRVGPPAPDAKPDALSTSDLLLEVATHLSGEPGLAFCCVPGPLLASESPEDRDALIGALGSIAPRVLVALAPTDGPLLDLVEALGKGVNKHPGEAAYKGRTESSVRPVVVGPDGKGPVAAPGATVEADVEGEPEADARTVARARSVVVAAQGVTPAVAPVILVTAGDAPSLEVAGGKVVLTVPPLGQPPHLYGLVTVEHGVVTVEWKTALGAPAPPRSGPVSLPALEE